MATMTLDNLISESGSRSGIGAAAEPLTRELIRLMTAGPGGLTAFLDRFRSAGLGAEVASFLGGRSEAELPVKTVDSVIGESTVANLARRVGVAPAAAAAAMGFEIPKLIGLLTPGGRVPAALPSEIQSFVGQEQVAPVGMATIREEERVRPVAMQTVRDTGGRGLGWLWALLALALLAGLIWMMLARNRVSVPEPRVTVPAVSLPKVAAPAITVPTPPAVVTNAIDLLNRDLNRDVLNFATGSAVLPAASAPQLQRAADQIKGLPAGTMIEIAGHTDNTGDADANMALSQRRADAVRDTLIKDGVPSAMLTAKGYGETRPAATNDTPDGRLQNRRTEFSVVSAATDTTR
jgi:outer membrane protein OmpA-like peptidoglycan-associated protein/uncharacterized protein YidB (DUF937 family)